MAQIKLALRIVVGLLLAALSAGLLLLSLPPYGFWPFALIGLAPMLFAQYRILPLRLANLAPAIGIGGFIGLVILSHFPTAMIDASPFLKFLTPGVMLIVYLTESGSRRFHERTHFRWFVLEGAVIWVGIELIRGLFVGTGGFIGYAFYQVPVVVQPISIFGIYGLSLLAMLINYALSLLVIALYDYYTLQCPRPRGRSAPLGRGAGAASGPSVPMPLARRWSIGLGVIARDLDRVGCGALSNAHDPARHRRRDSTALSDCAESGARHPRRGPQRRADRGVAGRRAEHRSAPTQQRRLSTPGAREQRVSRHRLWAARAGRVVQSSGRRLAAGRISGDIRQGASGQLRG